MQNTYPMTLTTPRLKTELVIDNLDGDIVMTIEGFGRWLLNDEGEHFMAIGFLPADEQTLEFESLAFFWLDWMDDLTKTEEFHGHSLDYEYLMYHIDHKIKIEYAK